MATAADAVGAADDDTELLERARALRARIARDGQEMERSQRTIETRLARIATLVGTIGLLTDEIARVADQLNGRNGF